MDDFEREVLKAAQETERILAEDPGRSLSDPTLPVYQVAARDALNKERQRWERGDKVALLGAMEICANHGLVMPEWVAKAFMQSYRKVLRHEVGSWDEAFGRPLPKGRHLAAERKRRNKAILVKLEAKRMRDEGRPVDDQMFKDIGKKLGIGKTLASDYFYGRRRR